MSSPDNSVWPAVLLRNRTRPLVPSDGAAVSFMVPVCQGSSEGDILGPHNLLSHVHSNECCLPWEKQIVQHSLAKVGFLSDSNIEVVNVI
jgi:hypothetical protein